MTSGRSGSAITAELGSMKLHEEIDALTVMGLRPSRNIDCSAYPRAYIQCSALTFIADMSGIFGGMMMSWVYAGINPRGF